MTIADIVIAILARGTKTSSLDLVDVDENSEIVVEWVAKIETEIESRVRTQMSDVIDEIAEIDNKDLTYEVMEKIKWYQYNKRNPDGT